MKIYIAIAALGLTMACAKGEEAKAPAKEAPAKAAPAAEATKAAASAPAKAKEVVENIDMDFEEAATKEINEANFESELDALEAELAQDL